MMIRKYSVVCTIIWFSLLSVGLVASIPISKKNDFYSTSQGGIVGYECGGKELAVTTVSLLDTNECRSQTGESVHKPVTIALTQINTMETISFYRCHGIMDHLITRCGKTIDQIHSRAIQSELIMFDREICRKLIETGHFNTPFQKIPPIKSDIGTSKILTSFVSSGFVDSNTGSCTPGVDTIINGISYTRPLINSKVEISYMKGEARLDSEKKQIIFPSGSRCNYEDEACHHADLGFLFWEIVTPVCSNDYEGDMASLIYIGPGIQFMMTEGTSNETFIQASASGYEFQLKLIKSGKTICNLDSYITEHPKLFITILPDNYNTHVYPLKRTNKLEANLLLYINSKMMFSMRHTKMEVMRLFDTFMLERCKIQNRISENLMTLALLSPRDFAYQFFSAPGYTAVTRGEVVHIAKCNPVIVHINPNEDHCYDELPVVYKNQSMFLTPRSRILVTAGKLVECTPTLTSQYFINKWVTLTRNGLMRVETPQVITTENITYQFEILSQLATGGLYTQSTLDQLQRTIIAPYEENVVSSRVVTALKGSGDLPHGYNFNNGFSEIDLTLLTKKIETRWDTVKNAFGTFGNFCSAIIGVILLIKCLSFFISSIINFVLLKKERGLLLAIIFFWWDSCAHHILNDNINIPSKHRNQKKSYNSVVIQDNQHDVELNTLQ